MANEPSNPEFEEQIDGQAVMPGFHEEPAESEETHPFIKRAVDLIYDNINIAQFNEIKNTPHKDFEPLIISLIGEIAANIEKDPAAPADDPASPNFDIEAFRQSLSDAGGIEAAELYFTEVALDLAEEAGEIELSPEARERLAEFSAMVKETAQAAVTNLFAFVNSEFYRELQASVNAVTSFISEHKAEFDALSEVAKDIRGLIPFLQMELDEAQNDPLIKGKTTRDIFRHGITATGEITDSPFKELIERAKKRREEYESAAATVAETEQVIEELQTIQGITPRSHVMPNNALMNDLTGKEAINAGEYDMIVRNASKRQKEITAYTMITFDPGETDITITDAKLSEYERQVSDAIVSLWIEAKAQQLQPIFTADMIFRAMPGGGDKASPQQRGAITKTIEKFRRLKIYVDATEEAKRRGFDLKGGKYVFDEYYLQVRRHTFQIKNGGAVVQGFEILSQPIIYTYCKLTNQLLTTPAENILIREVKNGVITPVPLMMNANRQALTGYMLRRILVMKRSREDAQDKKRSYDAKRKKAAKTGEILPEKPLEDFIKQKPVILFAEMFSATGTETASRSQTQDNRNFCFSVLDFWKAKGLIKGYSIRKTGRAITALEIEL